MVRGNYTSGALYHETPYANGKIYGTEKWYYESGALEAEIPYVNGREHGIRKAYYESGALETEISYENGIHGAITAFYESGAIKSISAVSGLNASNMEYYESGNIKSITPFENGKIHGAVYEYHESGCIKTLRYYSEGFPDNELVWEDHAKIAENCVMPDKSKSIKSVVIATWIISVLLILLGIFYTEDTMFRMALLGAGVLVLLVTSGLYFDTKSGGAILGGLSVICAFVFLIGIVGSFAVASDRYTVISAQLPREVARDSLGITVSGQTITVKSSEVSVFSISNPVLCKEERYNSFHMRLKDLYTIAPAEKCAQ
jgi:antitoxin component YwqK of YwqJK toxin-antitoxin module